MRVSASEFKGVESGAVAILGNGPSLNNWDLPKLSCPTIGINQSVDVIQSPYWVTVARARAKDVEEGKITASKAVFTSRVIDESIPQPIVQLDMSMPDIYVQQAVTREPIFAYDLTKPLFATFGGLLAVQVALFLGYTTIYLIGFDGGGLTHFDDRKKGYIRPERDIAAFWHVAWWLKDQTEVSIYQTNPEALIKWFPLMVPPIS